jgi:hypothetical protein
MDKVLNCALASVALHFSSPSSSSSLFFSAVAASRACLSSCSRSVIRCSRLLARSAKDCHTTNLSATLQQKYHQEKYIVSKLTVSAWLMVTMLVRWRYHPTKGCHSSQFSAVVTSGSKKIWVPVRQMSPDLLAPGQSEVGP